MYFPKLRQAPQKNQTLSNFGGYDHNLRIPDGFFYEMQNMTSDHHPILASRAQRGTVDTTGTVDGMVSSHGLCIVKAGSMILPDGTAVDMALTPGEKSLIPMGAYVVVFPDKKWINVAACLENPQGDNNWGELENRWQSGTGEVTLLACNPDGSAQPSASVATEKPANPYDGQLWRDYSVYPVVLKRWSEELGLWITEENTCIKLTATGIGKGFHKGDTVRIEIHAQGTEVPEASLILDQAEDWLVVRGYVQKSPCTVTGVTICREIPDMDLVIECGNRLWGCKYGITGKGFLNEIYCSKLGNFQNWNSFEGISTDSYVASIGTDGPFTGAVSYMGRPLFFKENCMIEVFGNYPANYQVQTTPCAGVQKDCHKSLAVVNNILYYKSRQGVCAFDGSMPVQKGRAFGSVHYEHAVAGAWDSKYCISMEAGGKWNLFVYDTLRDLWHREDDTHADSFAACEDGFFCLTHAGKLLNMAGGTGEGKVPWLVETGPIGLTEPEARYVSRLSLRLWIEPGARATVSCRYDNDPQWQQLCTLTGTGLGSFTVPIRPRRCDHIRLKLEGQGAVRIYALTKVWEEGSDLR